MPLLVAPLFAVSLGLCLGLLTLDGRGARGYLAARSSVRLFAAIACFPALLFAALLRPAWATMHFAGRVPSAVLLAGAALAAALVPLVYERANALGNLSRGRALLSACLPASLALTVLVLLHRRALVLTPEVPRLQEAEPLFGSTMGVAILLVDVLLVAAAGLTAFALVDEARPREARPQTGRNITRGLPARQSNSARPVPARQSTGARGLPARQSNISRSATSDAGGVVRRSAQHSKRPVERSR